MTENSAQEAKREVDNQKAYWTKNCCSLAGNTWLSHPGSRQRGFLGTLYAAQYQRLGQRSRTNSPESNHRAKRQRLFVWRTV